MCKSWIGANRGLPCANLGSTLYATKIHGLSAQTSDPRFAQHGVRRHKRGQDAIAEGLRSAAQGDVKDSYLGLGILHCSFEEYRVSI